MLLSKKLVRKNKKIKVKSFDKYLRTSKTIELLKFIRNKFKNSQIYFIMGSDNIIKLHRWHNWKKFQKYCIIVIFPRRGHLKNMMISKAYSYFKKEKIILLKSKIADISSSNIRKNYLL